MPSPVWNRRNPDGPCWGSAGIAPAQVWALSCRRDLELESRDEIMRKNSVSSKWGSRMRHSSCSGVLWENTLIWRTVKLVLFKNSWVWSKLLAVTGPVLATSLESVPIGLLWGFRWCFYLSASMGSTDISALKVLWDNLIPTQHFFPVLPFPLLKIIIFFILNSISGFKNAIISKYKYEFCPSCINQNIILCCLIPWCYVFSTLYVKILVA